MYAYDIDLWATSNVYKAGHHSLYRCKQERPRSARNANTGEAVLKADRLVTAKQKIYHDAQHPSALVLPVIPR